MINNNISEQLKEKIDNLEPAEQDDVYRYLWTQHVKEDVESFAENEGMTLTDDEIDIVAYRYVYEGDYDCNLSYWNNIGNLINELQSSQ